MLKIRMLYDICHLNSHPVPLFHSISYEYDMKMIRNSSPVLSSMWKRQLIIIPFQYTDPIHGYIHIHLTSNYVDCQLIVFIVQRGPQDPIQSKH